MIEYTGGTGGSLEEAIVIVGARDSGEGVQAEYDYIEDALGMENREWVAKGQSLIKENQCWYDIVTVIVDGQEERHFFFDISDFYGKLPDLEDGLEELEELEQLLEDKQPFWKRWWRRKEKRR